MATMTRIRLHEHRVAYIHDSGEVEGFVGAGNSARAAREDAIDQVRRKLDILRDFHGNPKDYNPARLVEKLGILSSKEFDIVRTDWASGVRYRPDPGPSRHYGVTPSRETLS